jgi:hypothetical protein
MWLPLNVALVEASSANDRNRPKSGQSADEIWLVPTHDVVCNSTPIQCIKWFAGMEASTLTFQELFRPGSASNGCTVAERCSSDFLINERSLLNAIVMAAGGHSDFMGCFVKGFLEQNKQSNSRLLLRESAETESGRILLYICPECGDIGCGAYAVSVRQNDDCFTWDSFAYENGYEEPQIIEGVGPFRFEKHAYEAAINDAAAF